MTVEFRQIEIADTDAFRAAMDVVARERKYIALLEAPPIEQVRAFVKRNVERGYPQIIAVEAGAVVGWCNVPPSGRTVSAHVGDLFMGLLPDFRGRGLGEKLLREAIQASDAFGFRRIELGVFATNTAAAALYRKVGFVEEGVKRMAILLDGIHHDEIIMARLKIK
ncbi:GNAT family N-acetyltransferase [Bradyrhizobium diazoefficiens]|nr:GNAT family N-acetyltransferase [Bradyrhizobium diazoefficiens]QQO20736.1 GNAT family N-acetyltransferase [Bradyrhizobium diazoefficiens]